MMRNCFGQRRKKKGSGGPEENAGVVGSTKGDKTRSSSMRTSEETRGSVAVVDDVDTEADYNGRESTAYSYDDRSSSDVGTTGLSSFWNTPQSSQHETPHDSRDDSSARLSESERLEDTRSDNGSTWSGSYDGSGWFMVQSSQESETSEELEKPRAGRGGVMQYDALPVVKDTIHKQHVGNRKCKATTSEITGTGKSKRGNLRHDPLEEWSQKAMLERHGRLMTLGYSIMSGDCPSPDRLASLLSIQSWGDSSPGVSSVSIDDPAQPLKQQRQQQQHLHRQQKQQQQQQEQQKQQKQQQEQQKQQKQKKQQKQHQQQQEQEHSVDYVHQWIPSPTGIRYSVGYGPIPPPRLSRPALSVNDVAVNNNNNNDMVCEHE